MASDERRQADFLVADHGGDLAQGLGILVGVAAAPEDDRHFDVLDHFGGHLGRFGRRSVQAVGVGADQGKADGLGLVVVNALLGPVHRVVHDPFEMTGQGGRPFFGLDVEHLHGDQRPIGHVAFVNLEGHDGFAADFDDLIAVAEAGLAHLAGVVDRVIVGRHLRGPAGQRGGFDGQSSGSGGGRHRGGCRGRFGLGRFGGGHRFLGWSRSWGGRFLGCRRGLDRLDIDFGGGWFGCGWFGGGRGWSRRGRFGDRCSWSGRLGRSRNCRSRSSGGSRDRGFNRSATLRRFLLEDRLGAGEFDQGLELLIGEAQGLFQRLQAKFQRIQRQQAFLLIHLMFSRVVNFNTFVNGSSHPCGTGRLGLSLKPGGFLPGLGDDLFRFPLSRRHDLGGIGAGRALPDYNFFFYDLVGGFRRSSIIVVELRPFGKLGPLDDFRHGAFPFDGHDMDAGHPFDLTDLVDDVDADVDSLFFLVLGTFRDGR